MEKVVALLPIKEHSERVKGKNFRILEGKPLYCWILETLLSCRNIDKVVIDTDSEKLIAEIRKNYPIVETMLRPEKIRGDLISMNEIIAYDMQELEQYNYFFQTHTTNPLLSAESIDRAVEVFMQNRKKYDSLFSVNRIQARTYWKNGEAINHILGELKRTQDLPAIYEENSNFFIFSRESFEKTGSRIGISPYLYETKRKESFEIDEEEDFELIKILLKGMER